VRARNWGSAKRLGPKKKKRTTVLKSGLPRVLRIVVGALLPPENPTPTKNIAPQKNNVRSACIFHYSALKLALTQEFFTEFERILFVLPNLRIIRLPLTPDYDIIILN